LGIAADDSATERPQMPTEIVLAFGERLGIRGEGLYNLCMIAPGQPRKTVNVSIDGYNFYYSINRRETLRLGWCNFSVLADRLAFRTFGDRYIVGAVKYYTSKVDEDTEMNPGEIERRSLWLVIRGEGGDASRERGQRMWWDHRTKCRKARASRPTASDDLRRRQL
jgi:hypothetical protein